MNNPEGNPEKIEEDIKKLSSDARQGLLFLCLLETEITFYFLSELVTSPEIIDELVQLPIIQSNSEVIWIYPHLKTLLLQNFKWSEKVNASESLAKFFESKTFNAENLGDLWLVAGKKDKAKSAYQMSFNQYKLDQSHWEASRVGEKLLNSGDISDKEEIEVLQGLLVSYECCGELSEVIKIRNKLLEKPAIRQDQYVYACLLRALAIDYSKEGNWGHYKKMRENAAVIFKNIRNFKDSSGEYMALSIKAIDELNLMKALHFSEDALNDAKMAGDADLISRNLAIKSYILAMDGDYKNGQLLAEEALQIALRNNLLETAAFVYRKLAGTYEYASDFDQAKMVYNEAIQFCATEKMEVQAQMCYSCLSWILLRLGEWKKALDVCASLIKDSNFNNPSKSTAHCVIAIIKSLRGEIRSAEKNTLDGIYLAQKEQFMVMYHLLLLPMAKINELKGNIPGAKEWYCKIIDEWHLTGEKHDVLLSLMDASMFFREQEDSVSLKKCLEIYSFICKETGNTEAMGCFEFGLGLDALLQKQFETATNRLHASKKLLEPLNIPYQLILVEYHLGLSHLLSGNTEEAKSLFKGIQPRAKKLGISPLIAKINNLVDNIELQNGMNSYNLTKRQLEVLQLISSGLSNKEIATKLFLSTRTVDMHVRYIFDKFYCHSRMEAVKIGIEKGLVNQS